MLESYTLQSQREFIDNINNDHLFAFLSFNIHVF